MPSSKIKVLFIDDDEGILTAINLVFQVNNIAAACIHPNQLLTYLKNHQPEIIFIDYLMSGINGAEVLKKIQSSYKHTFKSVLVSAHPSVESLAKKNGFNSFLKKPFEIEDLLNYVK